MYAQMVQPDAMIAAASHVNHEYGSYGYAIGHEGYGIFLVRHSDGSEFRLRADQWGNVDRLPDEWSDMDVDAKSAAIADLRNARETRMAKSMIRFYIEDGREHSARDSYSDALVDEVLTEDGWNVEAAR